MTTESTRRRRETGVRAVVGAVVVSLVGSLVVVAVAALLGDSAAVVGALAGGLVTVVVMAFGAISMHLVARYVPSASLMVALLTYVLQLVLMTAFLAALSGSGALGDEVSAGWLFAGVAAAVLGWSAGQIWFATRARLPVFDLDGPGEDR